MAKSVYINNKERQALFDAWEYVNNILENCSADEESEAIILLKDTLDGLESLQKKSK